mmetsp:Transcript_31000/g.81397  ORF Transcript_31000/g.81397 Transcript_31000/m.81397 type:complete len:108 (-) Transcript_31000:884-1207(-)
MRGMVGGSARIKQEQTYYHKNVAVKGAAFTASSRSAFYLDVHLQRFPPRRQFSFKEETVSRENNRPSIVSRELDRQCIRCLRMKGSRRGPAVLKQAQAEENTESIRY